MIILSMVQWCNQPEQGYLRRNGNVGFLAASSMSRYAFIFREGLHAASSIAQLFLVRAFSS